MHIGYTLINVAILEPGYDWCQNMYIKMLKDDGGFIFNDNFVDCEGLIVFLHGHFWQHKYDLLNSSFNNYKWVLAIRTGDEEDAFDISKIKHPNIKWWVQYPSVNHDYGDTRLIPVGFADQFNNILYRPEKDIDIFLAAQDTHNRRHEAFLVVGKIPGNNFIYRTDGFSRGLDREEYLNLALRAKIMPAPSGALSPDSFRLYEALEAGALPIADDISPRIDSVGFFNKLFPDAPFPIITDWNELPEIIKNHNEDKQEKINDWWTNYKKSIIINIKSDIDILCKKTELKVS